MRSYNDRNKSNMQGDILDTIYWDAKFSALKLQAALETGQAEGTIARIIPEVSSRCTAVLKEYPYHEEVKQWRQRADLLRQKIGRSAATAAGDRDFDHWNDLSYEAGWRFYHLAKMSVDCGYWGWTRSFAADAEKHFKRLAERMDAWHPEIRKWIAAARSEMQECDKDAAQKILDHFLEIESVAGKTGR